MGTNEAQKKVILGGFIMAHELSTGILLLALASGCGSESDFHVGPTRVVVGSRAESVRPDLPEALAAMQDRGPPLDWDFVLYVKAAWEIVYKPGHACAYWYAEDTLRSRAIGEFVVDSCLPHEIAHRCADEVRGVETGEHAHDEVWRGCRDMLWDVALEVRMDWL
jgi:hypothetical protein